LNPNLDIPVKYDSYGNVESDQTYPIIVAHRKMGSSSTLTFTQYLNKACPAEWPEEMVGPDVEFDDGTITCNGNFEMAECVKENGTIGYIDSGIGYDSGLEEVALKMDVFVNNDRFFMTSIEAIDKGGILSAVDTEGAGIPTRADADWSAVDLVYQVEVRE
jgi:hypothetical protein